MDLVNLVTLRPKSSLFILFCFVIFLSLGTANFDLDASSETLLLENDPDLIINISASPFAKDRKNDRMKLIQ